MGSYLALSAVVAAQSALRPDRLRGAERSPTWLPWLAVERMAAEAIGRHEEGSIAAALVTFAEAWGQRPMVGPAHPDYAMGMRTVIAACDAVVAACREWEARAQAAKDGLDEGATND